MINEDLEKILSFSSSMNSAIEVNKYLEFLENSLPREDFIIVRNAIHNSDIKQLEVKRCHFKK